MTWIDWAVVVGGVGAVTWVLWYFLADADTAAPAHDMSNM